jgi:hypothetical protein
MTDADERVADESSPLVGPQLRGHGDDDDDVNPLHPTGGGGLSGMNSRSGRRTDNSLESKSELYLFLLTLSIGG